MFTGIIEALGSVAAIRPQGGDLRLQLRSPSLPMAELKLGDSVATNGVCLTVVEKSAGAFWADVSRETLQHSALAQIQVGAPVNLERAMLASSRFDGHIVSGHVDGVGHIRELARDARSIRLGIAAPAALARYIASKGSIAVDGISLTVNRVEGALFEVNIVPHSAQQTIVPHYRVGDAVNLEVDIIARYLERLLQQSGDDDAASGSTLTRAKLADYGF